MSSYILRFVKKIESKFKQNIKTVVVDQTAELPQGCPTITAHHVLDSDLTAHYVKATAEPWFSGPVLDPFHPTMFVYV